MPHKQIRKLIKIGKNSLGVTIPRPWIEYYGIQYGDSVEVVSNGNVEIRRIRPEKGEG